MKKLYAIKLSERGMNSLIIPYEYRIWSIPTQTYMGVSVELKGDDKKEAVALYKLREEVERKLRALSERVITEARR